MPTPSHITAHEGHELETSPVAVGSSQLLGLGGAGEGNSAGQQGALVTVVGDLVVLPASTRPKEASCKCRPTAKEEIDYRGPTLLGMNSAGDLQILPQGRCPETGSATAYFPDEGTQAHKCQSS